MIMVSGIDQTRDSPQLAAIAAIARRSYDVADLEPLLLELRDYLRQVGTRQPEAQQALIELIDTWPIGTLEAVEFTMRELQWDAVRSALVAQFSSDADFRIKDQSRRVLEAFERDWPGGEIYATYRDHNS